MFFFSYAKFLNFVLKILGAMIILPALFIIPHLSKEVVFESLGTVCILGSVMHRGQMREKGESPILCQN